jgi:amidase
MDATDLAFAGATTQARLIASGEVSAREVAQATLDRIAGVDGQLNAYRVVLADRALVDADEADARRRAGDVRPLLGVPVAIKDDTDVAGEATAMGTAALAGRRCEQDAEVVRRLRAAGAVIVGKTNVPELLMWPFSETTSFGAARNPWNLGYTPGGSSGGSGAAVAAGLCGIALGSDGAGSIRIPAAFCGIFGIKPQRGRIPLAPGASDGWHGLAHHGPLARSVADAALFLDAVADDVPPGGFARSAALAVPARMRIAVSTALPPGVVAHLGAEQRGAVEATADLLRSLGHEVVEREIDYPPSGAANVLARYFRGIRDQAGAVPDPSLLEPRTRAMARLGAPLGPRAMARVRAGERALAARVDSVLSTADAILLPGPSGPPFRIGAMQGRGAMWTVNASIAKVPWYGAFNVTGQPACSVPAGFDAEGLPLAVQLAGRQSDEATLLALAAQIEQARPWADRRPQL